MKELPDDLKVMAPAELSEQRALRDTKIAPLFRRWPDLSGFELRQLRQLYAEGTRIARYLGRRRGQPAAEVGQVVQGQGDYHGPDPEADIKGDGADEDQGT